MEELDSYREAFLRRAAHEREALDRLRAEALSAARRAAATIAALYAPRRILLVGEVVRGTFVPGSHVQLAVEGLEAASVVEAEQAAQATIGKPIGILRLEGMAPGWRAHHERFGEVFDGA